MLNLTKWLDISWVKVDTRNTRHAMREPQNQGILQTSIVPQFVWECVIVAKDNK